MLNRTLAPEIQLPEVLNFPTAEKELLSNHLPLYFIKGSTEPVVRLLLFFESGRYFEHKKQVSANTVGMINKGTAAKNAYQIAETLEFYGASLRIEANMYIGSVSLSCLKAQLPYILPVINDILSNSVFPEDELKQLKDRAKQKLKINLKKNEHIASQHFNKAVFGAEHPFGYLNHADDIDAVTREDLLTHYNNHFCFNQSSFGVVAGDTGPQELKLFNHYLGSLKNIAKPEIKGITLTPETEKNIEIVRPKSVQAALRIGYTTIGAKHPDFNELGVLNTILGGYFGSRLMANIREDKGYTYGIYSILSPLKDISYLCISTEVGKEYKDATLEEIYREIERLKNEPVGSEELDMVKNYMVGQLMKSVDGPLKMANTLKNLIIAGFDQWELNKNLQTVRNVSPDRIQELAKKYLNFDEMYKVIAS
jgi:zinc protease